MNDPGNIQAFVLIAILVVTPAICIIGYGKPSRWRVRIGLLIGPALSVFCALTGLHRCHNGSPFMQWLIPGVCITAIMITARNPWIRFSTSILIFVLSLWLCRWYVSLVHTPDLHGNPAYLEFFERIRLKEYGKRLNDKSLNDTTIYPAGWMHETPLNEIISVSIESKHREKAFSQWHSWLTDLYEKRQVPGGIWYPGGRLSESWDKIEFRDYPTKPGS
jgi:hypothetical protein